MSSDVKTIKFNALGDHRGSLISLEANKSIPFDIKRVYYIYGTKAGVRRGYHAHKSLEQVLVCTSGSCKILLDNGCEKNIIKLDSPVNGLYVGQMIWREMFDFTPDCVLMVLANHHYDEDDYIRNYDDYCDCLVES